MNNIWENIHIQFIPQRPFKGEWERTTEIVQTITNNKFIDSGTFNTPRRPFEKERLDQELKYVGLYGLKNKREVWRVQYVLAHIRKAARELLTLDPKDPRRLFEGQALLNRMIRLGVLKENQKKLDYVLGLTIPQFLERRLQTKVLKNKLASSMHQARVLIRQRHIRVGKQMVNVPSFMVRIENDQHIDFVPTSTLASDKIGRSKRRKLKKVDEEDEEDEDDEEEEEDEDEK